MRAETQCAPGAADLSKMRIGPLIMLPGADSSRHESGYRRKEEEVGGTRVSPGARGVRAELVTRCGEMPTGLGHNPGHNLRFGSIQAHVSARF